MQEMKVYRCEHCGNVAELIEDKGVALWCCGEKMVRLSAATGDTGGEKHLPLVECDGDTVRVSVGELTHPMEQDHHIAFVWLTTDRGVHRWALPHTAAPEAVFRLADGETPCCVYAWCNLHGLWKTRV